MTRTRPALTLTAASAFAAALMLSGCAGPDVTASRLEAAIAPTFVGLYETQQTIVGRAVPPGTAAIASCRRTDVASPTHGAGDDWTCQILLHTNTAVAFAYEVNAKANGCYTATGSPTVVGGRDITNLAGSTVINPLFAFDGCYRTD